MVPGQLRTRHVKVGEHIVPEPEMIEPLLARFVEAYSFKMLSKLQKIVGVGASHHRLAWIHPFFDGNGRVSRLFSHALLRDLGIGSELWSVSRGLASGRFYNVVDLDNRLETEARNGKQGRLADFITRLDFVIMDELGYLPFAQAGRIRRCQNDRCHARQAHTPLRDRGNRERILAL